jgi:hypothetical protein
MSAGPQPIQRYAVNKFAQNRRSISSLPSKADGVAHIQPNLMPHQSPQSQAAASHLSSPALSSTKSPNFLPTGGAISPSFGPAAQQNQQLRPQPPLRPQFSAPQRPPSLVTTSYPGSSAASNAAMSGASSAGPHYYPSPFQNHYDQLGKYTRIPIRHRTLFVLELTRSYRPGVRCTSRPSRRARPHRDLRRPWAIPTAV